MRVLSIFILVFLIETLFMIAVPSVAQAATYGRTICESQGFNCYTVKPGNSWGSLFPNEDQRWIVMRINRINIPLSPGITIAVPQKLTNMDYMSFSPLSQQISAPGRREIIVDPKLLAWGAYDESGRLQYWGPAVLGKNYCPDLHRACHTPVGTFSIYNEGGAGCKSRIFPIPTGGAPMPYCMYFHGGYAIHGSELPGYLASHGCVRVFENDALWLQQNFAHIGTTVIVRPYSV